MIGFWKARQLRNIAKKTVIQGNHREKILEYYMILVQEAQKEFREDNLVTLNDFLRGVHEEALASAEYPESHVAWCDNLKQTI